MNIKNALLGGLAAFSLVCGGAALADQGAMQGADNSMQGSMAQPKEASKMVHGKITQVLKSDHELLLGDRATPLVVDNKARIWRDGKHASFTDLKPGDDIRASFDVTGAKVISIEVMEAATPKAYDQKSNDQNSGNTKSY